MVMTFGLVLPGAASAAGPERFETSFTYTLQDAIADYQAFGENACDCGEFVILVTYTVEREVAVWPDREVRHVHYTGRAYNSGDTSKSIERSGDFKITFWLDANGNPTGLTRTGLFEYFVINGQRVVSHVGRDELSFATGPISATPKAGDNVSEAACDALR